MGKKKDEATTGETPAPIKVGEKEFRNVEELTESYLSLDRAIGRQGEELGKLREMVSVKMKEPEPEVPDTFYDEFETVIYADPKRAAKMLDERIERRARRIAEAETAKITEMEMKGRAEDSLWDEFFERFPEWNDSRRFVKEVTRGVLMPTLEKITKKEDQFKEIDRYFSESLRGVKGAKELPDRRPSVEAGGGASGRGPTPEPKADEGERGFMDQLKTLSHAPKSPF